MSIWTMCKSDTPGAVRDDYWSKQTDVARHNPEGLFLVESHKGLVLSLGEVNGRDDSDFYAIVWNAEKQVTETVTYASTRGWTYPNKASVDATPEVLAAFEAVRKAAQEEAAAKRAVIEAGTPRKGRRVKVVKAVTKGKSLCKVGEVGTVFWYGKDEQKLAKHCRYLSPTQAGMIESIHDPREYFRAGVKLADGRAVFLAALSLEVTED